jgi:uncharacterized protein (DUF362 family)
MSRRLSRRQFLQIGVGAAAWAGIAAPLVRAGGSLFAAPPEASPPGIDLAVAHGAPADAVRMALDLLGGIGRFVGKGDVVLLKPNMSFATPPDMGATTHPEVVVKVAALCLDAGAGRVLVADHTIREPQVCIEYTGIGAACEGIRNVRVAALNDEAHYEEVAVPRGKSLRSTSIASEVLAADVFINLPVAKSHSAAGVAFGIKNLMGLVWDRRVFHTRDLSQCIADLATVLRPHLTVMDATRALVQGGPSGPGKTVVLDQVIAGTDPVAVDSYTLSLTKWYNKEIRPRQVKHLVAAAEFGLGRMDLENLTIAHAGEKTEPHEGQPTH